MLSRRQMLLNSTAATLATPFLNGFSLANAFAPHDPYLEKIGIQLYTLRNQMAENPKSTIEAVAKAGYRQIELMDVMDAPKIMPIALDNKLIATSAFLKWEMLGQPKPAADVATIEQAIEMAGKHQIKYLVFGYVGKGFRETADQLKAMADRSNHAGEKCKQAGIQLCYHHHSFEFQPIDSTTGMDLLIDRFDKKLVQFEIDVFWLALGGWDPVKTLERLDGRVAQVHLKDVLANTPVIFDEGKVPKEAFKEVGAGTIDMKSVIATSHRIGVVQCHVEQDQSPNPIESIQLSMANLRNI